MDIRRTESYDEQIGNRDVCNCASCQNDVQEIKAAYPDIADYLFSLGIDIEKPFETMPLEPDETGQLEYLSVQYLVWGEPDDFVKTLVGSVTVDVAGAHPSTQINEAHFVLEIHPIRLKWVM